MKLRKKIIFASLGTFVIVIGTSIFFVLLNNHKTTRLPANIVSSVNAFTPYFYSQNTSSGFRLDKQSVSYSREVLIFKMTNNKKQSITVTQQAVPEQLKTSTIEGAKKIDGVSGSASLSRTKDRTTATLITADPKTFIILNTTDAVSSETMKDLVRLLVPIRQ